MAKSKSKKKVRPRGKPKKNGHKKKVHQDKPKYEGLLPNSNKSLKGRSVWRLNKISTELGVNIDAIADYLEEHGFDVTRSPNSKVGLDAVEAINGNIYKLDNTVVCDYTSRLIEDLKIDYNLIFKVSPEQFERLVARLLEEDGFTVTLNGNTNTKDGGIDIIAYKQDIVLIVIAIQVKHKRDKGRKVSASEVRDLSGAISINDYFNAAMLVTNTDFTADARWIERKLNTKIELKNNEDIQNWLFNNYATQKDFKVDLELGKDVYFKS